MDVLTWIKTIFAYLDPSHEAYKLFVNTRQRFYVATNGFVAIFVRHDAPDDPPAPLETNQEAFDRVFQRVLLSEGKRSASVLMLKETLLDAIAGMDGAILVEVYDHRRGPILAFSNLGTDLASLAMPASYKGLGPDPWRPYLKSDN